MAPVAKTESNPLPLFVRLGSAGSRMLYSRAEHPGVDEAKFEFAVQEHLSARLNQLEEDPRFVGCCFCGISSMAVGADFLFTRAYRARGFLQRVFIPQTREEFLAAGSDTTSDFSPAQQAEAVELLSSPEVIEERVVSDSRDRRTRFQDVNLEIVRNSDVLVCLLRDAAIGKPGGSAELIELAKDRGQPVLEIRVSVNDGQPLFSEQWHNPESFAAPKWPKHLPKTSLPVRKESQKAPTVAEYCNALKGASSGKAKWQRRWFTAVAWIILGSHVLATVLAVAALVMHGEGIIPWLLGAELMLLATGFSVHRHLHGSDACQTWAISRLLAELARSVLAVRSVRVPLEHLFALPFPPSARPFLTTLQVLHLHDTRSNSEEWRKKRDNYAEVRLNSEDGQIAYYRNSSKKAKLGGQCFHAAFFLFSVAAIAATFLKLLTHWPAMEVLESQWLTGVLGLLAIVLPVLAVASLSLAAAMDLQAREHTFEEMRVFLEQQANYLQKAKLENDFVRLVQETESRLLGETVNWYSRRSFTGVT